MTTGELCPYWTGRTTDPSKPGTYAAYCRRPDGAVRIPSRDEVRRFCVGGHHSECPGYRTVVIDEMLSLGHS
jgi:hypothetical protein